MPAVDLLAGSNDPWPGPSRIRNFPPATPAHNSHQSARASAATHSPHARGSFFGRLSRTTSRMTPTSLRGQLDQEQCSDPEAEAEEAAVFVRLSVEAQAAALAALPSAAARARRVATLATPEARASAMQSLQPWAGCVAAVLVELRLRGDFGDDLGRHAGVRQELLGGSAAVFEALPLVFGEVSPRRSSPRAAAPPQDLGMQVVRCKSSAEIGAVLGRCRPPVAASLLLEAHRRGSPNCAGEALGALAEAEPR